MSLPLATAALMLLLGEGRRHAKATIKRAVDRDRAGGRRASAARRRAAHDAPAAFGVYLPGNWPVPYGIVLVADRSRR